MTSDQATLQPLDSWQWLGQAGHFCSAHRCRWHLHTHVGEFCISSVGEMYWHGLGPEPVGSGRLYETMVFKIVDGDTDGNAIDSIGCNDRDQAAENHMAMCRKYHNTKTNDCQL